MKVLLAALALVASVSSFDHENYVLKKWAVHKAMESCFGQDNVKAYLVRKRKAVAECMQEDAPELELSIFK